MNGQTIRAVAGWMLAGVLAAVGGDAGAAWTPGHACKGADNKAAPTLQAYVGGIASSIVFNGMTADKLRGDVERCVQAQPDDDVKARVQQCVGRARIYTDLVAPTKQRDYALGLVEQSGNAWQRLSNQAYFDRYKDTSLAMPGCLADPVNMPSGQGRLFAALAAVNLGLTPAGTTDKRLQIANGMIEVAAIVHARCEGAIVLPYITTVTPAIDADVHPVHDRDRHGRVIVAYRDEGTGIHHYVQFSVNAAPATPEFARRQASVVNVVPGLGVHVFDWSRNYDTNAFEYSKSVGNDQRCYQCHLNGMLEIHPFGPEYRDVVEVGGTLGDGWEARVAALNSAWSTELAALNRHARESQKLASKVVHGLAHDHAAFPGFPDFLAGYGNEPFAFRHPELAGQADACKQALADTGAASGTTTACAGCHGKRGRVVYDTYAGDQGVKPLAVKYVSGLLMPPHGETYRTQQQKVVPYAVDDGGAAADLLNACLVMRAQDKLYTWLVEEDDCGQ